MIKKMLPALIGASLAAGAGVSVAETQIFGHIDTSWTAIDIDGGYDDTVFTCTTCSVGFKGSEDLGNGLKAIFFLDWQYDTTKRNPSSLKIYHTKSSYITTSPTISATTIGRVQTSDSALTDRDQWLGLEGGFGKVRIGTISTLYKSHGAMIDPLYRTALQGRDHGLQSAFHSGAGEELQGRATNTLRWDSADYNGLKAGITYTLDSSENDGESDNPYGVGGSYENGNMLVFADYLNNSQSGSGKIDAWKLGGKYDMGMFSFMGQYEDMTLTSSRDQSVWYLGGSVNGLLGMNIYLGFGKGKDDTSDDEYTDWVLSITHEFSKHTMVYAGHNEIDCDTGGAKATLAACNGIGASGGEIDYTAFGIKHTF